MGQLKSDGRATQGGYTAPAGDIYFGDLYQLNGWNHIALASIASADTVRTYGGEISAERIWYVLLPAGLNPSVGDPLYWATPGTWQRGDTDLQATPATAGDPPACKVEEAKNADNYAAVRVLNLW